MDAASAPDRAAAVQDGLPNPQRAFAFLTLALGIVMAVLDGTIVNVALPLIAAEQGARASDAIWVVSAYQLAVVVGLLPMAALGEAIGFKRVLSAGLVIFAVASLLCAQADSIVMLTFTRVLQGIGGAAIMSVIGALVRFIMPVNRLGRGISGIALVVAVSGAAGPSVAAAILAVTSWHWLFLVNVPIGLFCVLVGQATLPMTPRRPGRFDLGSALLNAGTFGFLIAGLSGLGSSGIPVALSLGEIAAGILFGVLLVLRQRGRTAPMLPVDLLRIPAFAMAIVASVSCFTAQFLAAVALPFFFAHELGLGPVETGLLMTPWPVATAVMAPLAGRLSDRFASGRLAGIGALILSLGLLACAFLPPGAAAVDITWRLVLCGLGFGLFQSPNNRAMITAAPRERSGGASGMQATARVLGQSLGAAAAAIIFAASAGHGVLIPLGLAAALALFSGVLSIWR